jgi:hypothetical protein
VLPIHFLSPLTHTCCMKLEFAFTVTYYHNLCGMDHTFFTVFSLNHKHTFDVYALVNCNHISVNFQNRSIFSDTHFCLNVHCTRNVMLTVFTLLRVQYFFHMLHCCLNCVCLYCCSFNDTWFTVSFVYP